MTLDGALEGLGGSWQSRWVPGAVVPGLGAGSSVELLAEALASKVGVESFRATLRSAKATCLGGNDITG